tara:strand:- start:1200 stop:2036 length:837 start_codon:yes stop_codon:yes gene_type:complete
MVALAVPVLLGAACSAVSTSASGGVQTVVVLTADQATEIVVPAGFATATTSIATTASTEPPAPDVDTSPLDTSQSGASSSEGTTPPTTAAVVDEVEPDGSDAGPGDRVEEAAATTTTMTTTTVVEMVKETVPLAEEEVNPGVKLLGALDEFNACLASEGHEWIGLPDPEQGPEAPMNQPAYLQALGLCNSRTGISDAFQDFQASRSGLTPDAIREENEGFLDLVDCLRGLGWQISDLRPDADGFLQPGDEFAGPDGDFVTDDIRDCASEIALRSEDGE